VLVKTEVSLLIGISFM